MSLEKKKKKQNDALYSLKIPWTQHTVLTQLQPMA